MQHQWLGSVIGTVIVGMRQNDLPTRIAVGVFELLKPKLALTLPLALIVIVCWEIEILTCWKISKRNFWQGHFDASNRVAWIPMVRPKGCHWFTRIAFAFRGSHFANVLGPFNNVHKSDRQLMSWGQIANVFNKVGSDLTTRELDDRRKGNLHSEISILKLKATLHIFPSGVDLGFCYWVFEGVIV